MISLKEYESDQGGRALCKRHSMLRCSECRYIDELEKEVEKYREALESVQGNAVDFSNEEHIVGLIEGIATEALKEAIR